MSEYKWEIEIILSCGEILNCHYVGSEVDSVQVGKKLFERAESDIVGLANGKQNGQIFIKIRDVAAMNIVPE